MPQYGIEPHFDAYKATVIAIILQGQIWRKAEESNPIPFLRTQFSRLVAAPTQLHYFPKSLVVISGIDPLSLAYEASAHPSTPYHLIRFNFFVLPLHHSEDQLTAGIRTQTLFFPERLFLIAEMNLYGQLGTQ